MDDTRDSINNIAWEAWHRLREDTGNLIHTVPMINAVAMSTVHGPSQLIGDEVWLFAGGYHG